MFSHSSTEVDAIIEKLLTRKLNVFVEKRHQTQYINQSLVFFKYQIALNHSWMVVSAVLYFSLQETHNQAQMVIILYLHRIE